jgi:hypothetical protein
MLLAGSGPRTSRVTVRAKPAKFTAAWPAEFPAPTTNTSLSRVPGASLAAAP